MNADPRNYEDWDYSRKLDLLDVTRDVLQREGIFLRGFLREFTPDGVSDRFRLLSRSDQAAATAPRTRR